MSTDLRQLSDREIEILRLVSGGLSNQQIAAQLGISANTVKVHLRNIFSKTGAASRTEATLYAVRTGLVTVTSTIPVVVDEPSIATPPAVADEPEAVESESPQDTLASLALNEPDEPPTEQATTLAPTSITPPPEDIIPATPTERAAAQSDAVAATLVRSRIQDARRFRVALLIVVALAVVGGISGVVWASARSQSMTPTPTTAVGTTSAETSRWRELPAATEARAGFAIAAVNDVIYAIGGENQDGVLSSVARFDPQFSTWTTLSSKPTAVADVHAVVLGGRIYVPGGRLSSDASRITAAFERYDPRTETWEKLSDLPQPRSAYALVALEGKLYLFGGWDGTTYRAEVFAYDPDADAWSEQTSMPTARAFTAAAVVDNSVYVLGGADASGDLNNNEAYSPDQEGAQAWARRAPMPAPRSHFGAAAALTVIHVIGGTSADGPLQYNVRTDNWKPFDTPPVAIGAQPGVVLLETSIVSLGGQTTADTYADQMQSYQAFFTTVLP